MFGASRDAHRECSQNFRLVTRLQDMSNYWRVINFGKIFKKCCVKYFKTFCRVILLCIVEYSGIVRRIFNVFHRPCENKRLPRVFTRKIMRIAARRLVFYFQRFLTQTPFAKLRYCFVYLSEYFTREHVSVCI